MGVTLDVNDYEKIAVMIGRVEAKIDAWRKEGMTTEMHTVLYKAITDDMTTVKNRLTALENAPDKWLLRIGVIGSVAIAILTLLTHIKVLP